MLKLIVCLFLLCVAVDASKDLQNSDLDTVFNLQGHHRFKREIEPKTPRRDNLDSNYQCCSGVKRNQEEWKPIKEVKRKCIAEVRRSTDFFDPFDLQSRRQQMICVGECMAKKFDLLEENGDLKRDAMLEHCGKIIGDNEWKQDVLEEYVDKCLDEFKASKALNNNSETDKCNPYLLEFHHCIWKKFVLGCPAELQIDTEKCRSFREQLERGTNLNDIGS